VLLAGVAVWLAAVLARRSPPGIVARAAGTLEAVEADLDARLRAIESTVQGVDVHVNTTLEEILKASGEALKRDNSAKRTLQAIEAKEADGLPGDTPRRHYGHPDRIALIERAGREKGLV